MEPGMEMTGAEIVVSCLAAEGVEFVFGYPGGAVLNIYDAIFQQKKFHSLVLPACLVPIIIFSTLSRINNCFGTLYRKRGPPHVC